MGDLGLQRERDQGLRLTPAIDAALAHLAEAGKCAGDAGRSPWEFAVEIGTLTELGVTAAALRWLVCRGYADHARELTRPNNHVRHFRASPNLSFVKETCFILTPAGMVLAGSGGFTSLLALPRRLPKARPTSTPTGASPRCGGPTGTSSARSFRWGAGW